MHPVLWVFVERQVGLDTAAAPWRTPSYPQHHHLRARIERSVQPTQQHGRVAAVLTGGIRLLLSWKHKQHLPV
jgi:hypothetical protein